MKNIIYNLKNIELTVPEILEFSEHRIICLRGELGAGKTTLVTKLLHCLGATDKARSPSFGIVNEYRNCDDSLIAYHFDCYRLNSSEEALDLGIEEYWDLGNWIFIEWPNKINELLPLNRTEINITIVDNETRNLTIRNISE